MCRFLPLSEATHRKGLFEELICVPVGCKTWFILVGLWVTFFVDFYVKKKIIIVPFQDIRLSYVWIGVLCIIVVGIWIASCKPKWVERKIDTPIIK